MKLYNYREKKVEKAESVQMWKQVKFLCKSVTVQPDTHVPEKRISAATGYFERIKCAVVRKADSGFLILYEASF